MCVGNTPNLSSKDIINREHNLIIGTHQVPVNVNVSYLYNNLSENYSYNNAKIILENWRALDPNDDLVALDKVLEVFSIIVDNDTNTNIHNAANIIEGKIIPKIRDAKATRHLNNYKLGKLKVQNTKMLHHTLDNVNANVKTMSNNGYLGNSLHPHRKYQQDIYGRRIGQNLNSSDKSESDNEDEDNTNEETKSTNTEVEECVDRFIHASWVNDQCDRVISNHNKLSKRFDLDNKVRACKGDQYSIEECIYQIYDLIDVYDIPFGVKYNIALENIQYIFDKNCLHLDASFILETVTNYVLLHGVNDKQLEDMGYILQNAKFFDKQVIEESVGYIYEDEDVKVKELDSTVYETIDLNDRDEIFPLEEGKMKVKKDKKKIEADKARAKKDLDDIKKDKNKNPDTIKGGIKRLFVQSPEAIESELPDYMALIRGLVYVGSFALNPILGIITMITMSIIKMNVSRKELDRYVVLYEKEARNYKYKMQDAKNEKTKEKYKALYDKYTEGLAKIQDAQAQLYPEEEMDKKREELDNKRYAADEKHMKRKANNYDDNSSEFEDWEDFELEVVEYAEKLSSLCESFFIDKNNIMATIRNSIRSLSNDEIYMVTESVQLCNDIFDCPKYVEILEDELSRLRHDTSKSYIDYLRIDAIKECINEIDNIKHDLLIEENNPIDFDIDNISLVYENTLCKYNVLMDTLELVNRHDYLMEANYYDDTPSDEPPEDDDNPVPDKKASKTKSKDIQDAPASKTKSKDIQDAPASNPGKSNIIMNTLHKNINKVKSNVPNTKDKSLKKQSSNKFTEAERSSGLSLTSKLKISSENLRRSTNKLKDKDRHYSQVIDSELNRTLDAAKRAMTSDSREKVVKGSLVPSASKCIKMAITSGAVALINPALAVIGLLGWFGCSKKATEKERYLILDDIEVEIQMCDKYLRQAEDQNDLVAVREIMKIKRDLEAQKSRILNNRKWVIKGNKRYDYHPKQNIHKTSDE